MSLKNVKIVADSASDIGVLDGVDFASVPLKIITSEREYVDNSELDVRGMVKTLSEYSGRSSTSCPNAQDWLAAFGDADNIFCVTLTGTLSGSFNAAMTAKAIYTDTYPKRRVFVLNSLTAGPEMGLIVKRLEQLVKTDKSFDEICREIKEYTHTTSLVFMLASMKNFANNGRVSPVVAKMAGLLGIRVVGRASVRGDLEPIDKCKGEQKALESMLLNMKKMGYEGGCVRIGHCFNERAARRFADMIREEYPNAKVTYCRMGGLCCYYAEVGGMLVGFER